jgi:hypothetical protein
MAGKQILEGAAFSSAPAVFSREARQIDKPFCQIEVRTFGFSIVCLFYLHHTENRVSLLAAMCGSMLNWGNHLWNLRKQKLPKDRAILAVGVRMAGKTKAAPRDCGTARPRISIYPTRDWFSRRFARWKGREHSGAIPFRKMLLTMTSRLLASVSSASGAADMKPPLNKALFFRKLPCGRTEG